MDREVAKRVPCKHKCLDCKNVFKVSRDATWKKSRPYCPACGSRSLEPVEKEEAKSS